MKAVSLRAVAVTIALMVPAAASADWGDCAQPVTTGASQTASDCLFILHAAVGNESCDPECMCAPKGSTPVSASDALLCLKNAVGEEVSLDCQCPPAETVITIVNLDAPNEGFNSTAAAVPVGGNPGTTLGEQRRIAFQFAADLWAARLASPVEIRVDASFDALPCFEFGAVLGAAGPIEAFTDFPGAPRAATWYPAALANKLAGTDMSPSESDIVAFFNSSIGTTCSFPITWYYGLDGNPPPDRIDFVTVLLHELGHGLGFLTFIDLDTGQGLAGLDDHFMVHLENHDTGRLFPEITPTNRATVMRSGGNLHWVGTHVADAAGALSAGASSGGHVQMYGPNPVEPGSSVSHFNTTLQPNELMEPFYTDPLHDMGISYELMLDIGWEGRLP